MSKSTNYSEKVLDHFKNPRNVGTLEGENVATGRVGNPTCGDIMEIYIKVDKNIIEDIKFKTFGCGSAVATSSMTTEMAKGKSLDEAMKITRQDVATELDGLPPIKMHCSNLAADALHEAIKNYRKDHGMENPPGPESSSVLIDEIDQEAEKKGQTNAIIGEINFLNNGVDYDIRDYSKYHDKRTLVVYNGDRSIEIAIELTKFTGRVLLVDKNLEIHTTSELKRKLLQSDVKVLLQSKLLEIMGEGEVEKVKIHNLDENETYDLFVDAVIIPEHITIPNACSADEKP
jgi:nitrogen fixation NifU-like protein